MPSRAHLPRQRPGLPALAAGLAGVLVLAGLLAWFVPYLTRKQQFVAEVPAPAAFYAITEFAVAPHQQACMNAVTVDQNSRLAQFQLRPAKPTPGGGPPVDLVLSAAGYRGVVHVPGGYPASSVALPLAPPDRALLATACFVNRGSTVVLLDGTAEARTISRSAMLIDGTAVSGDIALTFTDNRLRSLSDRLGEVFGHASNLTDRLIPVWLIWVLAILVAFGAPIAVLTAFYLALKTDEPAGTG